MAYPMETFGDTVKSDMQRICRSAITGRTNYNPTAIELYLLADEQRVVLHPGETIELDGRPPVQGA
jgi:hypothetical protein